MKRNLGAGSLTSGGGRSSDSESSGEEVNFKRKRPKSNYGDEIRDEIDSRRHRNGGVAVGASVVKGIHSEKVRSQQDASRKSTACTVSISNRRDTAKDTNGDMPVTNAAGITCKASATEIMKQMGFDRSVGLGRFMNNCELSTDKLETLEAVLHKRGIVVPDKDSLDFEEQLSVEGTIQWINSAVPEHPLDFQFFRNWRKVGPRRESLADCDEFVDPAVLKKVSALRKCLDCLNEEEYQQVRARSNPFESLRKGPFISRAGMKMANLDADMSYGLTQPTLNSTDRPTMLGPNDLFYFADVCAGPGGFSEYILFRKKWGAKGFGMTLKNELDFDIYSFFQGSPESFETIYGPAGDGDVYNPANTNAFISHVLSSTDCRGVDLLMADGGFEVKNKELTEIYSYQIYLSQCYLALALVRSGGMFVCKFFDTLTPFSVGLIYLMHLSFESVAIHKPKTSRPANSERYLICKWKKQDCDGISKYLYDCYTLYWQWTNHYAGKPLKDDIIELVPMDVLTESKEFFNYIVRTNTIIARQQVKYLERMIIFARNPNLRDRRQEGIKKRCLENWKIPEVANKTVFLGYPEKYFTSLVGGQPAEFLGSKEFQLAEHNLETFIRSPYDWRVVVIEGKGEDRNRGFYLSFGRNRVYRHVGTNWMIIQETLELCKDTLVYGEFVDEIPGKRSQGVVRTFHIIDAMILGGTDVRNLHYTSRHEVCVKFAKSMNKPSRPDLPVIRAKIPVRMENIADIFDRLETRVLGANPRPTQQLVCPVDHTDETLPVIKPAGILFLKITKDPWTMALSRTSNRKYYFNISTGESKFSLVPESISSFDYTMQNVVVWWWDKDLKTILSTQDVTSENRPINVAPGTLNPHTLLRFVGGEWQRKTVMRRLSSSSSNHSSS